MPSVSFCFQITVRTNPFPNLFAKPPQLHNGTAVRSLRISGFERVAIWKFQGIQIQIDVQFIPIKMPSTQKLNMLDFKYTRILEPRKLLVGQEIFLSFDKDPETACGYIQDFNLRSVCANFG